MSEKIFRNSFIVGIAVLLLASLLFLGLQYSYYEEAAFSRLEQEMGFVSSGLEMDGGAYVEGLKCDDRITWIAADGTVLYDSRVAAGEMENHLEREEVQQALRTGSGETARRSDTLLQKSLYYAVKLSDGTVLRISCERSTITAILLMMLQPMLWALVLVVILSAVLSFRLSRQIVKPINNIDLDNPESEKTYSELTPLVDRLREQKLTIQDKIDELSRKQREFTAISENMSEGVLLIDRKGAILGGNASARRALGGSGELTNLHDEGCNPEICAVAFAALAGCRKERLLDMQDESWRVIANPVMSGSSVSGAAILIMDVTEQVQREVLRREFSANVSHELKTPLTSISGFAELMKEGLVAPEKEREFAGDIYRESMRMIALVDDIINLSKLDEDSAPLEREQIDLHDVCNDVFDSLQPVAAKEAVTLRLEGGAAKVNGVWQILNEMVYNLVDNAIKYNRRGGSVTVKLETTTDETRLSVADTGIGIPYAHQKRVFERFYRVDKSHSREIGGTGLGLSIVKHGALYHDARVELQSEPEVGTTVTLVFDNRKETV